MSGKIPRFSGDVNLFLLDDFGLVFSETKQELYELNTTATYIWCQIEEGLSPTQLATALSDTFGFSPEDAERHVREALADWQSRGFLEGALAARPSTESIVETPLIVEPTGVIPARDTANTRCYRILDQAYRISFATPEIETWVRPVLIHLEWPDAPQSGEATLVSIIAESGGFVIAREGGPTYRCARLQEISPIVVWAVFSDALNKAKEAIAIHAGAVSDGTRALILAGRAGSGKSTLTAAMVHAGLRYHSDDSVLLDLHSFRVRGVPFGLCVKEAGVKPLITRFPALKDLPTHIRPDEKRVRYLPVPQDADQSELETEPQINWIVFPTYDPEGDSQLAPISPSAALLELTKNSALIRTVTRRQVGDLLALVGRAQCFEIRVSSLEVATKELIALWEKPSPAVS